MLKKYKYYSRFYNSGKPLGKAFFAGTVRATNAIEAKRKLNVEDKSYNKFLRTRSRFPNRTVRTAKIKLASRGKR